MSDFSRLHLIPGDAETLRLFDRETLQMFPLDLREDRALIEILQKEHHNAEEETELNELLAQIEQGPASGDINKIEGEKAQFTSLILPIASSCNLTCPYCFAQTSKNEFNFPNYTEQDIDSVTQVRRSQ